MVKAVKGVYQLLAALVAMESLPEVAVEVAAAV